MANFEPLPHEWMLVGIIGFFVSWLYVFPYFSVNWGVTFMLFFLLIFIASMVNMSQDSFDEEHMDQLAIHELRKR